MAIALTMTAEQSPPQERNVSTSHENLDAPITGQWRSSPFYVAVGAPALASALSIIAAAICYRVLPLEAAREQMAQINAMLLVGGGGGALTGAYGIVARGLAITKGKIEKQLPPKLPKSVNSGTANINAAPADTTAPDMGIPISEDNVFHDDEEDPDVLQAQAVLEQEARNAER